MTEIVLVYLRLQPVWLIVADSQSLVIKLSMILVIEQFFSNNLQLLDYVNSKQL